VIKTNKDKMIVTQILGEIVHPVLGTDLGYMTTWNGKSKLGIGMGSIKYNVKIGDPCFGWAQGENVEPGVAIDRATESQAFRMLASLGNSAAVVSGEAKGATGVVIGKHGNVPQPGGHAAGHHVLVAFEESDMEKLSIGTKVAVKARGVGLRIEGLEDVKTLSIDPELLERICAGVDGGELVVPVVMELPAYIMGQGGGGSPAETSSFAIQTSSPIDVEELKLRRLRLGDLVACRDILSAWGRGYYRGAVTVGVVCSGSSDIAGHGIEVTCILTSASGQIRPRLDTEANIGYHLGLLRPGMRRG